jgi:hypothetical protein
MNQNQPQQMQIKAQDEVLKGAYANVVQISHTKEEVVLDFMNILPPQGQLVSRVIMSPSHAKRVLAALDENLKRYEKQFGALTASESPKSEFGFSE